MQLSLLRCFLKQMLDSENCLMNAFSVPYKCQKTVCSRCPLRWSYSLKNLRSSHPCIVINWFRYRDTKEEGTRWKRKIATRREKEEERKRERRGGETDRMRKRPRNRNYFSDCKLCSWKTLSLSNFFLTWFGSWNSCFHYFSLWIPTRGIFHILLHIFSLCLIPSRYVFPFVTNSPTFPVLVFHFAFPLSQICPPFFRFLSVTPLSLKLHSYW